MAIFQLDDLVPDIHPDAWVAETASVIGRVRLAARSSVWFGAVLRGDNDLISIGEGSNVQDGAVLHTDPGRPLSIASAFGPSHQSSASGRSGANRGAPGSHRAPRWRCRLRKIQRS